MMSMKNKYPQSGYIPCATHGQTRHGEGLGVAKVGRDVLELCHGGVEAGAGRPDVAIVSTDDSLRVTIH